MENPEVKATTVVLGTRNFQIHPMTFKRGQAWRRHFSEKLGSLSTLIERIAFSANTELNTVEDLSNLLIPIVNEARTLLIDSMDDIFELILEFSPELARERKYIEENALDEQIVVVFVEAVKFAFPFANAIRDLMKLGSEIQSTATSSSSQNTKSKKKS